MVSKIIRNVPVVYYIVDGVEFDANDLFATLEIIVCDGDSYGLDCDLYDCADKLLGLGYLVKRYGYHQSIIYYDTEDCKAKALFEKILHL